MGGTRTGKVVYISIGKFVAVISSLLAGVVLSRYLTKDAYGTYRQLWLVYDTLFPLIILGLPKSVNYFIPRMKENERKVFNTQTFFLLTILGGIFTVIFYLGAPFIAKMFHNPMLVDVARLFALIPLLTFPTLYYPDLFVCLDKITTVAILSVFLGIGRLLSIVIPVLYKYGLKGVLIGLLIFSFLQLIIVAYLLFKPFGINIGKYNWRLLKSHLHYSVPIGMANIVGKVTRQLDKLFISYYFFVSQYAVYANGAIEVPLIGILTGSVTAILLPEFVHLYKENNAQKMIELWHVAIRKVSLIILPVMVFLLIYAPEFLTFLFSKKYMESTPIFRIYLLSLPNRVTTFGTILLAVGLPKLVFRYSVYALILNGTMNLVMVKLIGFPGPAIATVLSIYFVNFLQLRKIKSLLHYKMVSIFPWRIIVRIFIISCVIGVISAWPKIVLGHHAVIQRFFWGGLTYVIGYLILGSILGIVRKDDFVGIMKGIVYKGQTP